MRVEAAMSFPILVHQDNGHFVASLIGEPKLRATAPTRDAALAELQQVLQKRVAHGDLVFLDLPRQGNTAVAGYFRDDPTLQEIRDEIYRERNAEPKE